MSEFIDFSAILAKTREEIPEPVDVPIGTNRFKVLNASMTEATASDPAKVLFACQPTELGDDVDTEDAAAFDEAKGYETGRVFVSFFMRDMRNVQDLIRFLEDTLQIDMHGVELKEGIRTSKGYEFWAYTYRKPNKDDADRPYTNLKAYQPIS